MIKAPDWHLFKSIEIADAQYNQPQIKNFPTRHHFHLRRCPPICLSNTHVQNDFPSCNNRIIENEILGKYFAGIHLMSGVAGNIIKQNHMMSGNLIQPLHTH